MFDKCCDQHKKPVCFWLHVIGLVVGIYGLWMHNWTWIIVALVVMVLGHLFVMKKKKVVVEEKPAEEAPAAE